MRSLDSREAHEATGDLLRRNEPLRLEEPLEARRTLLKPEESFRPDEPFKGATRIL